MGILKSAPVCAIGFLGLPCLGQTPAPTHVESVTVVADRGLSDVADPSTTSAVLTQQQLEAAPALTLDDTLRQVAGFQLFRRTSSWTANPTSQGVSLRGLGSTAASRSLVVSDETPLNDAFGGWIHWNEIPELAIQDVVVERGGAANLYGSSAISGIVDVVPVHASLRRALDFNVLGASKQTASGDALTTWGMEHFASLVALSLFTTDGYVPTAPQFRGSVDTPANVTSESARMEVRTSRAHLGGFLRGNFLNETRHNGTPLQTNGTRLWRYSGGLDLAALPISGLMRIYGSHETYRQTFSAISSDRNSERLTRIQRVPVNELGGSIQARIPFRTAVVALGCDAHDVRATDDEQPVSNGLLSSPVSTSARQQTVGAFSAFLWQPQQWTISASVRADIFRTFDGVTYAGVGRAGIIQPVIDEAITSPRLGLARSLPDGVLLFANSFRAFRGPTLNELYRTGQVGQQTTLANPNLHSERATGFELGSEVHAGQFNVRTSYFWTEVNRPVSAVLLSQSGSQQTLQRQNLGQIRSRGIDMNASSAPWHGITTDLGYQLAIATVTQFRTDATLQADLLGRWIPQVPRESVTARVAYHSRYMDLHAYAMYIGRQFDDAENQYQLRPFSRFDFSAERNLGTRVVLFAGVQNAGDRTIEAGRTPILTLAAPRIVQFGLRVHLDR